MHLKTPAFGCGECQEAEEGAAQNHIASWAWQSGKPYIHEPAGNGKLKKYKACGTIFHPFNANRAICRSRVVGIAEKKVPKLTVLNCPAWRMTPRIESGKIPDRIRFKTTSPTANRALND